MRGRLTLLVPRVGFGAVALACFAVPVVFTREAAEAFAVVKVTLLWLCLLVALLGLAVWTIAARRMPVPRLAIRWPLGVLVVWTLIATAASSAPAVSIVGHHARYDGLMAVIAGAVAVLAVVGFTWRDPARLEVLQLAIVGSGIVGMGYIAIQQAGWDWVHWLTDADHPIDRPYGLLGNSNFSGAHLALCLPLVLALAHRQPTLVRRAALWGLAATFGLGIWWTETRGGMMAAVGGIAVATTLLPELAPKAVRWGAVGLTVIGALLILQASTGDVVAGRTTQTGPRVLQATTLADRREIWATSAAMVADHPLVGVGPDALWLRFPDHRANPRPGEPPLNADEAHDVFLDRAATSGLPALAAYLWLLGAVAIAAWRARRRLPAEERRLLAAFGGMLGAYLLQGAFSIDVVPLALLGWVAIGALASLADPASIAGRAAAIDDGPVVLRPVRLAVLVALVAVTGVAATLALRPLRADVAYRDGQVAAAKPGGAVEAAADFARARDLFGLDPTYRARAAEQLVAVAVLADDPTTRLRLLREARRGYDDALAQAPGDVEVLGAKARLLGLTADEDPTHRAADLDAALAIRRAVARRTPTDIEASLQVALASEARAGDATGAERRRRRATADVAYRATLALDPASVDARLGRARLALDAGNRAAARRLLLDARRRAPDDPRVRAAIRALDRQTRRAGPR